MEFYSIQMQNNNTSDKNNTILEDRHSDLNDYDFLRIVWCDLTGIRRCKVAFKSYYNKLMKDGLASPKIGMSNPASCDMAVEGSAYSINDHIKLFPDLKTLRKVPWRPKEARIIADMYQSPGVIWKSDPRNILKKVYKELNEKYGYKMKMGFETEFTLLDPNKLDENGLPVPVDNGNYSTENSYMTNIELLNEIAYNLNESKVDVTYFHGESGNGQYEFVTGPKDPVSTCDDYLVTKDVISSIVLKHKLLATFLPKYGTNMGNGAHLTFSLQKNNENGEIKGDIDKELGHFMAGILENIESLMVFTNTSVNSYARLQPGYWCGAYKSWGISNKEASLRVMFPTHKDYNDIKIELKIVDNTTNPYLTAAAICIAGMLGIDDNVQLPPPYNYDPNKLTEIERKEKNMKRLPETLLAAVNEFNSNIKFKERIEKEMGSDLVKSLIACEIFEFNQFKDKSFEEQVKTLYMNY